MSVYRTIGPLVVASRSNLFHAHIWLNPLKMFLLLHQMTKDSVSGMELLMLLYRESDFELNI